MVCGCSACDTACMFDIDDTVGGGPDSAWSQFD
jgi:hypothetical protein